MADSALLPYNLEQLPKTIQETLDAFEKDNTTRKMEDNGASLRFIQKAVQDFATATRQFQKSKLEILESQANDMQLRVVNDQMMQLERVFNMPNGIPGRPGVRNAIFAPGKFNAYAGGAFPGIADLLHEIDDLPAEDKAKRWKEIKRHVSDLMIMLQEAARFLQPVEQI